MVTICMLYLGEKNTYIFTNVFVTAYRRKGGIYMSALLRMDYLHIYEVKVE